jgi:hypothetical protein
MAEKQLILPQREKKPPELAGACERRFFVAPGLMKDRDAAHTCLLSKFDQHLCRLAHLTITLPRQ